MKQLIQNLKTGETTLTDVPVPRTSRGKVLIRTTRSLVSLGTERMLVEFGKANLLQKARQQPDKVRQVIDKIKTEGLRPTVDAVFKKLDEPLPLGYCNVGRVVENLEFRIENLENEKKKNLEKNSNDKLEIRNEKNDLEFRNEDLEFENSEKNLGKRNNGDLGVEGEKSDQKNPKLKILNSKFKIGSRVVSNGAHAEFVCVPENLCARIPDNVSDDEAAFTAVGAIALQGVRLCNPTFGETVVVIGLGLIGLLTCQFLKANGCRVVGVDIAAEKLNLAAGWGVVPVNSAENDPVAAVMQATGGVGADGVIITASAKDDDIVHRAAQMSRKRGRIILVGVVGLNLSRADFYEKELTFQVSCSYGPGRYDAAYEQKGLDYPVGFVRWTEKRNFEAVLEAISTGKIDVKPLITERVALEDYQEIYGNMGNSGSIASLLVYPESEAGTPMARSIDVAPQHLAPSGGTIGIIGAGNFTKMTVLPALKKCGAQLRFISSAGGLSGTHLAKKYGIAKSTTDHREILKDPDVSLVLITTRHNLHAPMVMESLRSGKHVFVEKPLCLTVAELDEITTLYSSLPTHYSPLSLTVGFNRRFSRHIQALKKALGENPGPMNLAATMNAGAIPPDSWVQDMDVGGGRIIGEACHLMDLLAYLSESPIAAVCMNSLGPNPNPDTDNASILIRFANGSNGVVNYFANGHKGYAKERVEVFSQGRVAVVDNFRRTEAYGFQGFKGLKTRIDKGHNAQFRLLLDRLQKGGEPLIPFPEIANITRASFACIESLMKGKWVEV